MHEKNRAALRQNQRLIEDLGDIWRWTKTVVEQIIPILKTLKQAGIRFDELVDRLEQGDTVREAIASLAAGDLLAEHGISGDEAANRRLTARYCKALRAQLGEELAPEADEVEEEAPEVDLSAPPPPPSKKK